MKVLVVSSSDLSGGASRCAFRLHKGLLEVDVDSYMLVWDKKSHEHNVLGPSRKHKAINYLQGLTERSITELYRDKKPYANFSPGILSHRSLRRIDEIQPDIINLHWINGAAISIDVISKIKQPIVWSMHDMWAFTGGCHYDYNCNKFIRNCGQCPVLGSQSQADLSRYVYRKKLNVFNKKKELYLVSSSNWLCEQAQKSSLLSHRPIEVIPTGLDLKKFKPIDKSIARNILNLPQNQHILLFGSLHGTADVRKGFDYIPQMLQHVQSPYLNLALLGNFKSEDIADRISIPVYNKGVMHDEEALALLYSAADLVLLPSIQENLANICLEALACGTPVVAFDIGGNRDMIRHRENGYLVTPFDTREFAKGIDWILAYKERIHMVSQKARATAEAKFDFLTVATQYKHLFNKIYHTSFKDRYVSAQEVGKGNESNTKVSSPSCS